MNDAVEIELAAGATITLENGATIGAGSTVVLGAGSSITVHGHTATNNGLNPVTVQSSGISIINEFATEADVQITGAPAAPEAAADHAE